MAGVAPQGYMPADMVQRVLRNAGEDVILVGGQALAIWVDRYDVDVPSDVPAISRDVDFFTGDAANTEPLRRFARAIGGSIEVMDPRNLTALVGIAYVEIDQRLINVDVIHQVVGLSRARVQQNAVRIEMDQGVVVRVMHPMDVLISRAVNLHQLADKQNEEGRMQLELAIEMVRRHLEHVVAESDERATLKQFKRVIALAKSSAGRKVAERHGLHVADALPVTEVPQGAFWGKQWPHLRKLMSPAYLLACEPLVGRS